MSLQTQTDFRQHYETLGLTPDADWRQVQSAYRQLLIRWHPDRHRHNNTLHEHATRHFIGLTTAFNELRSFQREHQRLPLQAGNDHSRDPSEPVRAATDTSPQSVKTAAAGSATMTAADTVTAANTSASGSVSGKRREKADAAVSSASEKDALSAKNTRRSAKHPKSKNRIDRIEKPVEGISYSTLELSDEQLQNASLVRGGGKPGLLGKLKDLSGQRQYQMVGALIGLMLFVILLVVVLDKTNSNWRHNEASRIVIESGVSEFVRPPDEILRGRSGE